MSSSARNSLKAIVELDGGHLRYEGTSISLPEFEFLEMIGRGANGIVFRVRQKWLNREEALKIWIRLRERDDRDKIAQGILEAQNLAAAECPVVIPVYSAGLAAEKLFYSSMQYIRGVTLKRVLDHPNLEPKTRLMLACRYGTALIRLADMGLVHGDPHAGNVLLRFDLPPLGVNYADSHFLKDIGPLVVSTPIFCDFGTSAFLRKGNLRARNWRVSRETVLRILDHPEIVCLFDRHPIPDIMPRLASRPHHDGKSNERLRAYRDNPRQVLPLEVMEDSLHAQHCFQLANFATKLWRHKNGLPPLGAHL